jgi:hypothetical protein
LERGRLRWAPSALRLTLAFVPKRGASRMSEEIGVIGLVDDLPVRACVPDYHGAALPRWIATIVD